MNKIQRLGIVIGAAFLLFVVTQTDRQAAAAPYDGHVVVAKAGGDYTSISAAMAAINPTATNPYVIEVRPGTYTEQITFKSHVHLKGSGANVTTINGAGTEVLIINGLTNVMVSGFTLTGGYTGISIYSSSSNVTIENNVISNNSPAGISINGGSVVIRNNVISGNFNHGIINASGSATVTGNTISGSINGIYNLYGANTTITENTITGNGTGVTEDGSISLIRDNNIYNNNRAGGGPFGGNFGIMLNYSSGSTVPSSTIKGNTITGNLSGGVSTQTAGSSVISDNKVTGNGTDVTIGAGTSAHVSYNIYDTITVTGAKVGQYNLKSDGTPAP